jgi:hypothetical protein
MNRTDAEFRERFEADNAGDDAGGACDYGRIEAIVCKVLSAGGGGYQEASLTAEGIAALAGFPISKKTIRRLELRGLIARVQGFSRPALYSRASVDAWLAGRRR